MAKDAETSKPKHLNPTSEYYLSSQANSATARDPDRTPTGRPWCTFCHQVGHTQEKCYRHLGIATPVGLPDGLQTNAIKADSVSLADDITLRHVLYVPNLAPLSTATMAAVSESESYELSHRRMGHPSSQPLIHLPTVLVVSPSLKTICDVCCHAKHTRTIFPDSTSRAMDIFGLIHCDIWGPYRVSTISGAKYFLTIVDDYSRAVWVYLMHDKGQTGTLLRNFCNMVHTQFGKLVKIIRSDNDHEFDSQPMTQFYNDHGILHQTSIVDTPKQNGRVERKHRHILEVARALRFQANLPIEFWGECVLTAAHLINRTLSAILKHKTPHELLFQKVPSYSHLRVFGCLCYAHTKSVDKFAPKSRRCVFLGYPPGKKGWRVYDLETNQVFFSRDVKFEETVFPFTTPLCLSPTPATTTFCPALDCAEHPMASPPVIGETHHQRQGEIRHPHQLPLLPLVYRVSLWVLTPRSPLRVLHRALLLLRLLLLVVESSKRKLLLFSKTMYVTLLKFFPPASSTPTNGSSGPRYRLDNFVSCKSFSTAHTQFLDAVFSSSEPRSYKTASHDPKWRAAMRAEIDALKANGTWTIEDLPPDKKPIGSKWVYKIKFNSDGSIERYKARVVVRGDTQVEGLDYTETFAPVAKMVSVRVFLAVAVIKNWEFHQMNINNAFLHGDLHEEVYIQSPLGFSPSSPNKVLRLRKSLCGLRQSPRNWFAKLSTARRSYGFLYTACSSFKQYLNDCFKLKDLGPLKYFLGIEAARGPRALFLSQRKYALDILSESGLSASKPAAFPVEQNHGLALAGSPLLSDLGPYQRLIGHLVYLTITRPDICYVVHVLS
ncbi:hypothetical protein RJ639_020658 [Escallonia herrerae]|uniref:Integrase catalytic domain-containing protein n=1 Tax=Escallonia herrerae TaxID=1293975 RepID=A0AA89AFF6_9ASTE|nr:hypothetical protein RJ639_020658 [Escallonia herrerae]